LFPSSHHPPNHNNDDDDNDDDNLPQFHGNDLHLTQGNISNNARVQVNNSRSPDSRGHVNDNGIIESMMNDKDKAMEVEQDIIVNTIKGYDTSLPCGWQHTLQHEVYQDLIQREASKHMQLIIIIFN
jgi:hypothetical protein